MFTSTLRTTKKLTRQKQLCDYFVSNCCSFVDYVVHNLESFVVLDGDSQNSQTKKTEIKPTLVWRVGGQGIYISLAAYIGGDTHITLTQVDLQ